jgi:NADH:ubiquinone oxidoreductase subunit E
VVRVCRGTACHVKGGRSRSLFSRPDHDDQ